MLPSNILSIMDDGLLQFLLLAVFCVIAFVWTHIEKKFYNLKRHRDYLRYQLDEAYDRLAVLDPHRPRGQPAHEDNVPYINYSFIEFERGIRPLLPPDTNPSGTTPSAPPKPPSVS
jgi:hypothetical protein